MRHIFTIFKKEMLDTLRDRRTVLTMIVMPILLMPLLLTVTSKITENTTRQAEAKKIKIAITANGNGAELVQRFKRQKDVEIVAVNPEDYVEFIRKDSLDLALNIAKDFDAKISDTATASVQVFYDRTDAGVYFDRAERTIERYNDILLRDRIDTLEGRMDKIQPIRIVEKNVYNERESIGKMVGGILPYLFVIFCLMGAMYPAIDLFTGEKERQTIETILTVPVSRLQILLGKMLVVVLSGVISGLLTIFGLFLALQLNASNSPEMQSILNVATHILNPLSLTLVVLMLIPLTTFFSGILIPASIYARSFKEAQSLIQPMIFVIFIPLFIAMMPGFKLNTMTALVPVLNVALATKEIVADTIDFGLLALVFVSLFVFAGIGIGVCVRWFSSEGNILRK